LIRLAGSQSGEVGRTVSGKSDEEGDPTDPFTVYEEESDSLQASPFPQESEGVPTEPTGASPGVPGKAKKQNTKGSGD